jgi:hypothetical protein
VCAESAQHIGGSPSAQGWADHTPGDYSRGCSQWAWPAQRPGLAAKRQMSATPVDAPPAWRLASVAAASHMLPPNSAVHSESTHNAAIEQFAVNSLAVYSIPRYSEQ